MPCILPANVIFTLWLPLGSIVDTVVSSPETNCSFSFKRCIFIVWFSNLSFVLFSIEKSNIVSFFSSTYFSSMSFIVNGSNSLSVLEIEPAFSKGSSLLYSFFYKL